MDKREELKDIIKSNLDIGYNKLYTYPDISDKIKAKITKNFDSNINTENIVAFLDTSFVGGKNGIVFTITGVYYTGILGKVFYFNYLDIVNIEIEPDKKGKVYHTTDASMTITLLNEDVLLISDYSFDKANVRDVLWELKKKVLDYDDVMSFQSSGEVGKLGLTEEQTMKCNAIIHAASVAAGGVGTGFAQIPLVDSAVITPIQITMITSLGGVFGIRVTEGLAKGIISGGAASVIGRGATQVLLGWIPGLGNVINTATAVALTESIGWLAVVHFFDLEQKEKAKYKIDGLKQGYNMASEEYEVKLHKEADKMINERGVMKGKVEEYEQLLSEYAAYMKNLEEQNRYLKEQGYNTELLDDKVMQMRDQYNELTKLRTG